MKKISYIIFILCFNFLFCNAQKELKKYQKKIENSDSVVFFGIDFSNAKFLGDFPDKKFIIETAFDQWNSMLVSSDFLKSYREKPFLFDFTCTTKRNKQVKETDLFTLLPLSLTPDNIQSILNDYKPVIEKGKGVVFIVESFDKNREEAKIWVVYFQIETRKVLYAKMYIGQAIGINIVNHWGNAIQQVIKQSSHHPNRIIWESMFFILFAVGLGYFIASTFY
jgi:hypothetical protein